MMSGEQQNENGSTSSSSSSENARVSIGSRNAHIDEDVTTSDDLENHRKIDTRKKLCKRDAYISASGEKPRKRVTCDVCGKKFAKRGNLLRHHRLKTSCKRDACDPNTGKKSFTCSDCGKKFEKKYNFDRHRNIKKPCKYSSRDTRPVQKQLKLVSCDRRPARRQPAICNDCGKTFAKKYNLVRHHQRNACNPLRNTVTCNDCGKECGNNGNLTRHREIHTREKLCKSAVSDETLEKSFRCDDCGQVFAIMSILVSHQRTHMPREKPLNVSERLSSIEKLYKCDVSEREFGRKISLVWHEEIHREEQSTCDKKFATTSVLAQHHKFQSAEKPLKCNTCHMEFSHVGHLSEHKKTHIANKTFCGKKFLIETHLHMHRETRHMGQKSSYNCDVCGNDFQSLDLLNVKRETTYSGEKPFNLCDVCKKKSTRLYSCISALKNKAL